ncbi:MAG: hypothetical protein ACWGMZ_00720 [Thermoguttaceae bacterium]
MSIKYLLPCSCGHTCEVEQRQAGEIITCVCGKSLEVPTLLTLKSFEQVENAPVTGRVEKSWATGHRILFLGLLIVFGSILACAWLYLTRPMDPFINFSPEQMRKTAENLSPVQSFRLWLVLEKSGLERHKRIKEMKFEGEENQHQIFWGLWFAVLGLGIVLSLWGMFLIFLKNRTSRTRIKYTTLYSL